MIEGSNNHNAVLENNKKKMEEKAKIIKELETFSIKYDNKFDFKDYGLDPDSEFLKNKKIKKEILEGLNKKDIDSVEFGLKIFKSFLEAPIFTDKFHKDHNSRREWEAKYINSSELRDYYDSNRLGLHMAFHVIGFLSVLKDQIIINPDVKSKLINFLERIPPEIWSKEKKEVVMYADLDDEKKIKIIKIFTQMVEELVSYLEEK